MIFELLLEYFTYIRDNNINKNQTIAHCVYKIIEISQCQEPPSDRSILILESNCSILMRCNKILNHTALRRVSSSFQIYLKIYLPTRTVIVHITLIEKLKGNIGQKRQSIDSLSLFFCLYLTMIMIYYQAPNFSLT